MKGSTILKKVLPIVIALILVIGVAITVTAVKKGNSKASQLTGNDDVYISIKETVDGKDYTYSLSKGELYTKLKDSIGLSSAITMANIDILKDKKNDEGISIWDSVTEDEIKDAIAEACYGADVDLDELEEDEKADLEKTFLRTMYTGYGYDSSSMYSKDIMNHYRLVLAKKAYAKYALNKAIKEADSDDPYFSDDKIDDYYDDNYDSSFYAILVPFTSSDALALALQQQRVQNSTVWESITLNYDETNGKYTKVSGSNLSTFDVIKTSIALYNLVFPDKQLVEGTATYNEETKSYDLTEGCDYAIVEFSADYEEAKNACLALAEVKNAEYDKENMILLIATAQEKVGALKGKTGNDNYVENILSFIQQLSDIVNQTGEDVVEGTPEGIYDDIESAINALAEKAYIFNLNNEDSPLYFDYTSLYEYDSNLPSKISSNYGIYTPFESLNNSSALWYAKSSLSSNSVYYVLVKLAELEPKKLEDVKEEIIAKLTEDELTDTFVEVKMAELREEYKFKFYQKDLEQDYIEAMADYTEHKENKKKSSSAVFSTKLKEYSADDLFEMLEKTSGLTTAISEIAYARLLNNPTFNVYKNMETGKWIGKKGEELKKNITENVENQRLYFLSGSYASYGYTPDTMTFEEFLYALNGVHTEYELAEMSLYSTISTDYINKALDFAQIDGEDLETSLKMSYKESKASAIWALVEKRMNDLTTDTFSCNGEHLLISLYENVKESIDTEASPLDPKEWTDEQKQAAKDLINDVKAYLLSATGTYAARLDEVVKAFNNAPYAVKDSEGKYVDVIDSNGNLYKYTLDLGDVSIDLAKYKSYGFVLKHETLSTFGPGDMVESFEAAAKEIWAKDMELGLTDNITVYKDAIETVYGFHLYVNLGSEEAAKHESIVVDEDGNPTENTVEVVIPSLYEVRAYLLNTALSALDTTDYSDEDLEKLEKLQKELSEILTSEVSNAITNYYANVAGELTGSYFSAILQQEDILGLLDTATFNSKQFKVNDFEKITDATYENVYESNLKYVKLGDEELFDITSVFGK